VTGSWPSAAWAARLFEPPAGMPARLLPLLATCAAVVVAAGVVAALAIRARRLRATGTWWEITPPAHTSTETMVAVWRTVAGLLHRRRGWFGDPARVAFEAVGTDARVRVGVWLPASLRSAGLAQTVQAAWPGATLVVTEHPGWPPAAVSAMVLRPLGGRWAPLVHASALQHGVGAARGQGTDGAEEQLRALFTALADRAPGELVAVQIVARPHPSYRAAAGAAGTTGIVSTLLGALAGLCAGLAIDLVESFIPGQSRHATSRTWSRSTASYRGSGVRPDAVQAAAAKAIDTKRIDVPHLAVTLRVALATPASMDEQARRHRLALIRAGLDLVTVPLRARWLRRPSGVLNARLPGRRWFVATTAELAALWHIPTSPERYGLTLRPARTRPPSRALPRVPIAQTHRTGSSGSRDDRDFLPPAD
jgi:hypothetical protein